MSLDNYNDKTGLLIDCLFCGRQTKATLNALELEKRTINIRETIVCSKCKSFNRQRQVLYTIFQRYGVKSLQELRECKLSIYLMETGGPLYEHLCSAQRFICSDYFPGGKVPVGRTLYTYHADVQELRFADNSFDLVISSDVFEHVPDPYKGFAELYRVLKPGGAHIFTVPFGEQEVIYALPGPVFLKEPIYHLDGLRKEGSLVYRYFGKEDLINKLSAIGMDTKLHFIDSPRHGIYGNNAYVFESVKI